MQHFNKNAEVGKMDFFKMIQLYTTQQREFRFKETKWLKVKGRKDIYHAIRTQ